MSHDPVRAAIRHAGEGDMSFSLRLTLRNGEVVEGSPNPLQPDDSVLHLTTTDEHRRSVFILIHEVVAAEVVFH
jgi:hypothetical protein